MYAWSTRSSLRVVWSVGGEELVARFKGLERKEGKILFLMMEEDDVKGLADG